LLCVQESFSFGDWRASLSSAGDWAAGGLDVQIFGIGQFGIELHFTLRLSYMRLLECGSAEANRRRREENEKESKTSSRNLGGQLFNVKAKDGVMAIGLLLLALCPNWARISISTKQSIF